jgi:hypothetical protein
VTEAESHFLDEWGDLASLAGQRFSKELLERYLERNWYQYFSTKVRCLTFVFVGSNF